MTVRAKFYFAAFWAAALVALIVFIAGSEDTAAIFFGAAMTALLVALRIDLCRRRARFEAQPAPPRHSRPPATRRH